MGLGAPADLIFETQRAAADEVEHAREMYTLLSSLLGHPVGPGAFPSAELAPRFDRREITLSVAREACLGETLGVAEVEGARALSLQLRGPQEVCDHLAQVADDETRHAALAWRTLAWLLKGASNELHDEVATVLSEETQRLFASSSVDETVALATSLNRFGVLSAAQRRACYVNGLTEVLLPCAQQLLGATRVASLTQFVRRVQSA